VWIEPKSPDAAPILRAFLLSDLLANAIFFEGESFSQQSTLASVIDRMVHSDNLSIPRPRLLLPRLWLGALYKGHSSSATTPTTVGGGEDQMIRDSYDTFIIEC
jgi:hypothetical protein